MIILKAVLSAGLAGTLALGIADGLKHSDSAERIRLGLRITPGDSAAWMRLARATPGSEEAHRAMEEASRANPRDSTARIALALEAEAAGDLAGARRELMAAMATDRGFLPVWTLANFCFRHNDPQYSPLLRKALAVAIAGAQDTAEVFDLAWQAGQDIAGNDPEALRLYVPYLIQAGHAEAVFGAAMRLKDPRMRLKAAECSMAAGRDAEFRKLTGAIAFNSELNPPDGWTFDWKYNATAEQRFDFGNGVRIELSGNQPEQIDLMSERIGVTAGERYQLHWETAVDTARSRAKLLWVAAGSRIDASASGAAVFTGKPGARLVLRLERALGEQAFAGTLWIRRLSVHAVDTQ